MFTVHAGLSAGELTVIYQHGNVPAPLKLEVKFDDWLACAVMKLEIPKPSTELKICEWEIHGGKKWQPAVLWIFDALLQDSSFSHTGW